jgi:FAD/FMN-containing dehydrogenase
MTNTTACTLTGQETLLDSQAIDALRATLRGEVLMAGDASYDAARAVWNGMIDRRPALIVRCRGTADVIAAVNFARGRGLLLSVRAGGHGVAGAAVCDRGIVIDLSSMRGIRVDPVGRAVRAEPGLTWKELDQETMAFGLTTTGGTVSSTGIAGLTLGGGIGWHMARHGLTCDNLISVDIVTADGQLRTASTSEHADLFWAVRGGGGNFGIVSSFKYQLHPMEPLITGGMVLYPIDQAREVLRFYRSFSAQAPDDLTAFAGLFTTPEGLPVVAIIAAWFGADEQADTQLQPLRSFGVPLADLTTKMPYGQLQSMFDAAVPSGLRRYWKSGYFPELPDDLLEVILEHSARGTSPHSFILFFHIHGKAARVAPDATAFGARANQWDFDIIPQWTSASDDRVHMEWARTFWAAVEPFSKGVYANHLDRDDGAERVRAAYGSNVERLRAVKRAYDPQNMFRTINNIALVDRT